MTMDVTERQPEEEARQKHDAELERFLYTASHDRKSPVVTVRMLPGYLAQNLAAAGAGLAEACDHHANSDPAKPVDFAQFRKLRKTSGCDWLAWNRFPQ
jgi:hypothetical protein